MRLWFDAVERGRVTARWIHPETAQPTRRLLTAMLWLFAIVMAYPYLPGSNTEAFKGVSVFLGLMLTLGSSGLVNQIMSGFMITYSRALRHGRLRARRRRRRHGHAPRRAVHEDQDGLVGGDHRCRNAVIIGQTITDYSRLGETHGVFTPTSLTIGYDAPWRQVQSLLLLAADRTSGCAARPSRSCSRHRSTTSTSNTRCYVAPRGSGVAAADAARAARATSRICSTSTACRSCRRTTSSIRRRRKWSRSRTGSRRRPALTRTSKTPARRLQHWSKSRCRSAIVRCLSRASRSSTRAFCGFSPNDATSPSLSSSSSTLRPTRPVVDPRRAHADDALLRLSGRAPRPRPRSCCRCRRPRPRCP